MERARGLSDCNMYVDVDTHGSLPPFTVTAVLKQDNEDRYDQARGCRPDCTIPYAWDGREYVKGERVCKKNETEQSGR